MRCRPEPQVYQAAPPPPLPPPPTGPLPASSTVLSWLPVVVLVGAAITTLAGSFVAFVLYLRPVLVAAEKAAAAAERAAQEMGVAAQVRSAWLVGSPAPCVQRGGLHGMQCCSTAALAEAQPSGQWQQQRSLNCRRHLFVALQTSRRWRRRPR